MHDQRTDAGGKHCSGCGATKPLDDFHHHPTASQGRTHRCKSCVRAYGIANREQIRTRRRRREREAWYGLTDEQYQALLARQSGGCAICGRDGRNARKTILCVDHDHETGAVRGLLCDACNRGMGLLGDSADTMRAALRYLENNYSTK